MNEVGDCARARTMLVVPLYRHPSPTLTDAEREAVAYYIGTGGPDRVDAALRGLLERLGSGGEIAPTAKSDAPPQPEPAPDWMSRPYWVDPPSGWRYGFPRLYDPRSDGPMRVWLVKNGYPQAMADPNLHCTFTATEEAT